MRRSTSLPSCLAFVLVLSLLVSQTAALRAQEAVPAPSGPSQPHTLLDGTPLKLRLSETISSSDAKVGQEIPFEVIEEVKVDDVVVVPKGASAIATVTEADHKKSMGRAGKLNISITYVRLGDNEKAALRAVKETKGGGHVGAMTGAIVATSIIFFPAAPLFLFIHGKDVTIPQGTEITAFVEGDMHLDMSHFSVAPASTAAIAAPTAPQQASIAIDSNPPGAEIEVDGAFVGNAPSTITVAPGTHEVSVKKKGFSTWTRKLTATGGSVRISAELEAESPAATAAPAAAGVATPAQAPQ